MVYLDYNASTQVDVRVHQAMDEVQHRFGNPASAHHRAGQAAAELVGEARSRVARMVGGAMQDVIFRTGVALAGNLAHVETEKLPRERRATGGRSAKPSPGWSTTTSRLTTRC